jgi:hypothetical protein
MSVFTESAVHLRDEIVAWRRARAAFRNELERATQARQRQVSSWLGAVACDLAGARRSWSGLAPARPRAAAPERLPRRAEAAPAGPREHPRATPPEPAPKSPFKKQKKH